MKSIKNILWTAAGLVALAALPLAPAAQADIVHCDDVIINCGSLCVGFDCVNGETFGFDTIRMKENNVRLHFLDTSTTASFPQNDWRLIANDSANGGANYLGIEDSTAGRIPFRVEAGAPSHSLYVDDGGRIGFGTATPVVDLHVVSGNTPTLRLEQDGSSGFTPQTWDVAGNETNFFVRDATSGSTLPFRIRPGGAPTSSLDIQGDGDIGIGTSSPDAASDVHLRRTSGDADLRLEATAGTPRLRLQRGSDLWNTSVGSDLDYEINSNDGSGIEFQLEHASGDLTIEGSINTTDCSPCVSDYVFEPGHEMLTLAELEEFVWREKHLPNVPSQNDVDNRGKLNMTEMQMRILEKVEELVLYTIDQQKLIDQLTDRLRALEPAEQAEETEG